MNNVNETVYKKYKSAKSAQNYISNMIERKTSLFQTEGYVLWKIAKNWKNIVGETISNNTEPKWLKNGNLILNVDDSTIYHSVITFQNEIIQKINEFLKLKLVNKLEIKKINKIIKRDITSELCEITEEKEKSLKQVELDEKVKKEKTENDKLDDLNKSDDFDISSKELNEIKENIGKIDKKYAEFAKRLENIAINRIKKEKYLLQNGYIICNECKNIFYPGKNETVCFECYEKKEQKKEIKMIELIKTNPYVGEKEAIELTETDSSIYYKIRDVLSERVFSELVFFSEKMNIELEVNFDYNYEIKQEAKQEFEKMVKLYIDYKIGSDNKDVYNHERKKLMRKLKNTMRFRK